VIGDLAHVLEPNGRPLPQLATVAKQQGAYVARAIAARASGTPPPGAFAFRSPGSLAIIGRSFAVADFGWLRLTGLAAWLVWAFAHIFFLIGFRNRISVFLEWAWEWFTYKRGARLIVDVPRSDEDHRRTRGGQPIRQSRARRRSAHVKLTHDPFVSPAQMRVMLLRVFTLL